MSFINLENPKELVQFSIGLGDKTVAYFQKIEDNEFEWQNVKNDGRNIETNAENKVGCEICCKTFAKKSVQYHRKIHRMNRHNCSVCARSFLTKQALNVHQRVHCDVNKRPFQCQQCFKTFQTKQNLENHQHIHTGSKPFQCCECQKCFREKSTLKKHMVTHSKEKKYLCPFCEKTFTQLSWYVIMFCCLLFVYLPMTLGQLTTVNNNEGVLDNPVLTPSNLRTQRCSDKLGMESGDIPDDRVSVSSTASAFNHGKEEARLNGGSAWVTFARKHQWIQIDLGKIKQITGVKTQSKVIPRYGKQLWVTGYSVKYKMYRNQSNWNVIADPGDDPKLFPGNNNGVSTKTNKFPSAIQAKLIRIVPVSWMKDTDKIAIRLDLLGCDIAGRSGCGSPRVMRNPQGSIFSMNYPQNYDNNANCRWDFTAPTDQVVVLEFAKFFVLEANHNFLCLDYVEVLDVVGNVEKLIAKFCGNVSPGKFASTYNRIKVYFWTDHFEAFPGFKADYKFVNGSNCGGPRVLQDSSGIIQTMNYPGNYENYANCLWDIYTASDHLIEIRFTEMRIRGIPSACSSDSLQIIDMGKSPTDIRSLAVTRLCGISKPGNYLSSSSHLRILFKSDEELTDKGFYASYTSVRGSGCGGKRELNGPRGTISTLNYPNPYDNGLSCEWNIRAGPDEDIQITFLNFDLEEHDDCQYDHVSIYDGNSERHLLGKYCNKLNIQPLVAHRGAMKIIFESDLYNARSGFEASYTVVARSAVVQTDAKKKETTEQIPILSTTVPTSESTSAFAQTTSSTFGMTSKRTTTKTKTPSITSKRKSNHYTPGFGMDGKNPLVTEELARWIIIGLVSVAGLVVLAIIVGVVLCCRQHTANRNTSIQGSLRHTNSGMMQNHAYDFSLGSTSQSIRSRQIDAADSSQVSETVSHQDPLRVEVNRDSHIYFSIDDYCRKNKPNSSEQADVKIHFKNTRPSGHDTMLEDDESDGADQSETEEDYSNDDVIAPYESEPEDCSDSKHSIVRTSVGIEPSTSSTNPTTQPKMMVDNILYQSTTSINNAKS